MMKPLAKLVTGRTFAVAAAACLLLAAGAAAHEDKKKSEAPAETAAAQTGETQGASQYSKRTTRLLMPIMNPARGRKLFAAKGCVTCHSINGVGGEDATNLDAHSMQPYMNPFDFAARMWRGAAAMIALQEEAMGAQIEFTGDELADIIAFVHDD
ncbi:MAG: c-type cytochrome, partial [Alphaproteobacteria bacterium]